MISSLRRLFTRSEVTSLTQSRRHRRFSCFVPILCTLHQETESAMIVDMADGGLRLLLRRAVKPGSILQLHYGTDQEGRGPAAAPVQAKVAWCRRREDFHEVGVHCSEGQVFWVPFLLRLVSATPDQAEVRRTIRFNAELNASLSVHFGPTYVSSFISGKVADLSLGGAAFYGPVKAQVGTMVDLCIEPPGGRKLTLQGTVVRQTRRADGRTLHGIRFEPLTAGLRADLSRILADLRTEARNRPVKRMGKPD